MARRYYGTELGIAYLGDSMDVLRDIQQDSVNLILTSPPFPLNKKKAYGNVRPDQYVEWFMRFALEFRRILTGDDSLVVEFGSGWNKGQPTRSTYQYQILIEMCEDLGFHLAQDLYWYNPAKLPTPAQWVTIERTRLKDAVTTVWWLSKSPRPKADNSQVLVDYSPSMVRLLKRGTYNEGRRPSGHVISNKFAKDNGGAIPPNLIRASNTRSSDRYQDLCRTAGLPVHPARFPPTLPGFFIKFLTDPGDLVVDPFAGSNLTGWSAQELDRRWISSEIDRDYLRASKFRFHESFQEERRRKRRAARKAQA